ncbi:hypothetical protein AGMMS49992_06950 [Clostridia bacterium]|nr:hypothetical protein AGMMS49992_06950 [Clostridia bacterium]
MIKAAALMLSMLLVLSGAFNTSGTGKTVSVLPDAISIQSIKLDIAPNYGPALGSIYRIELSIDGEQCIARVIQETSYCSAEDGRPSIEVYVYHEQVGDTPDDAFELFSKQALQDIAANGAPGWVESGVQDGDITRLTIYTADGLFSISGVNADEDGPRWFVDLCDQMKRIISDSGIDLDEVFSLYGR